MILLATLPSDAHSGNLLFLERLFVEHGFSVRNLGICTPVPILLKTCVELRPSVVVVSATNGHHVVEGRLLVQHVQASLEADMPALALAGNLTSPPTNASFPQLIEAGFDDVFQGPHSIRALLDFCHRHMHALGDHVAH